MPSLESLLEFVSSSPTEPLPRYALGMEYRNLGRHEDAVKTFRELASLHPEYVPTYLMLGQTLIGLGRAGEARAVLTAGLGAARQAGNRHAAGELQEALDSLD
jgi:tetratricopeptide (TPR) repeat protein